MSLIELMSPLSLDVREAFCDSNSPVDMYQIPVAPSITITAPIQNPYFNNASNAGLIWSIVSELAGRKVGKGRLGYPTQPTVFGSIVGQAVGWSGRSGLVVSTMVSPENPSR